MCCFLHRVRGKRNPRDSAHQPFCSSCLTWCFCEPQTYPRNPPPNRRMRPRNSGGFQQKPTLKPPSHRKKHPHWPKTPHPAPNQIESQAHGRLNGHGAAGALVEARQLGGPEAQHTWPIPRFPSKSGLSNPKREETKKVPTFLGKANLPIAKRRSKPAKDPALGPNTPTAPPKRCRAMQANCSGRPAPCT